MELGIELCGLERRGGALCEQCVSTGGAVSTGDGTARAGASGVVLDDGRRGAWFTWGRGARSVDREPGVRGQGVEEKEGERRRKEKERGKRERGATDFSAATAGPVGHTRRSGDTQRVARNEEKKKMGRRLKSGVGTAKISGKGLGV